MATFFPESCRQPFHSCISTATSWQVSWTARVVGMLSCEKNNEPLIVRCASANCAETCISPPKSWYEQYPCSHECSRAAVCSAPLDAVALPHATKVTTVVSFGKYCRAPAAFTTFHAAIASDSDIATTGSPN